MADQPQQENSFSKGMKMTFGIVFALFILGVAIPCATCGGCATCASMADYSERSKAADEASSNTAQSESAANEATPVRLGESFSLGNFSYTVQRVEAAQSVGNQMMGEKASDGATFVIVYFEIRNEGKETSTVATDDFQIRDSDDRTFRASSNANTALSMASDKDFILSELQPGIAKTTATVFEVPEGSISSEFEVLVPEKGLMGSGAVSVVIQPDEVD